MKPTADLLHIVLSPNVRAQLSLRDVWNELKPDLDVFPVDRSTHNRAIMECMLYAPTCGKSVCSAWDSSRITEQLESITFHNISPWDVFYYAWMSLDAWLAQVWVFKEWQAQLRKRAWSFWTGQPAKWWHWWNRFFHVSMKSGQWHADHDIKSIQILESIEILQRPIKIHFKKTVEILKKPVELHRNL